MNADIKAKWVAALRSGGYKQGVTRLFDSKLGRFCCLGVLCDLYVRDGHAKWEEGRMLGAAVDLPSAVFIWAQLPSADFKVCMEGQLRYVTSHNDGGRTFTEMADAIEDQL